MRQPETSDHNFVVGRFYRHIRGDITTLDAIRGQSPHRVEERLGYKAGRLAKGYSLLILTEKVALTDFIWSDKTHYSGGDQYIREADGMVPRRDVLRGQLLVDLGSDAAADAKLYQIFGTAQRRINEGVARGEICKVFPNIPHDPDPSVPRSLQYPDSPDMNVPQWTLARGKTMSCVANVLAGAVYGSREGG